MPNDGNNIDMTDARSAFDDFFGKDDSGNVAIGEGESASLNKVINKVKDQESPSSKREVTKVDATDSSVSSLSVDEAQQIVDSKKEFKDLLKELKISWSEIFAIIDFFLTKGYYEKKHTIKGLSFTFRTKKVHSVDTINDALDGAKYTMDDAAGQLILEYNLAASLYQYKRGDEEYTFTHNNEDDDAKALAFVRNNLTTPLYTIMAKKLREFDIRVGLASHDEALDHFLAHQQD